MDTPPLRVQTRAGASAVKSGASALDYEQERRCRRPLRDEWSSLRAPSPTVTSLLVWTNRSSAMVVDRSCGNAHRVETPVDAPWFVVQAPGGRADVLGTPSDIARAPY